MTNYTDTAGVAYPSNEEASYASNERARMGFTVNYSGRAITRAGQAAAEANTVAEHAAAATYHGAEVQMHVAESLRGGADTYFHNTHSAVHLNAMIAHQNVVLMSAIPGREWEIPRLSQEARGRSNSAHYYNPRAY